jgi:hypothetical protein
MIGHRLFKLVRQVVAVVLAAIILVSVFEGHSARAYFGSTSEHVHLTASEHAGGHDHGEPTGAKGPHAHYEDHSHNIGLIAPDAGKPLSESDRKRWIIRVDADADNSPDGLLRPPRSIGLR